MNLVPMRFQRSLVWEAVVELISNEAITVSIRRDLIYRHRGFPSESCRYLLMGESLATCSADEWRFGLQVRTVKNVDATHEVTLSEIVEPQEPQA